MRVVVRSEEYLPASRREMPPAPLGFHGPRWRTIEDLTGAEQAIGAGLAFVLYGATWLAMGHYGIGTYGRRDGLAVIAEPLVFPYALWRARRQPWYGPARLRREPRSPGAPGRLRRGSASFWSWWAWPGRPALAIALLTAFFGAMALIGAADGSALVHDLESRGVPADARVARLHYAPRVGRDDVKVTFSVGPAQRTESLSTLDSAGSLHVGQSVEVVYDPRDPSRVLLPRQLNFGSVHDERAIAVICFVLTGAGVLWWLAATPVRRERRREGSPST